VETVDAAGDGLWLAVPSVRAGSAGAALDGVAEFVASGGNAGWAGACSGTLVSAGRLLAEAFEADGWETTLGREGMAEDAVGCATGSWGAALGSGAAGSADKVDLAESALPALTANSGGNVNPTGTNFTASA
jgi:hypothetical protein